MEDNKTAGIVLQIHKAAVSAPRAYGEKKAANIFLP